MKQNIHPDYQENPFFTGKQKLVDTSGRVDMFKKRYGLQDK